MRFLHIVSKMVTISIVFLSLFSIFSLAHLIGELIIEKNEKKFLILRYITKPFLMPLLLSYYISALEYVNWFLIFALIFGFIGDIFLMLPDPEKTKKWLRIGLISFLIGHLVYIAAFIYEAGNFSHFVWWSIFLAIPFIIAALVIHPKLTKYTGKMTIAVTIYIIVIALMGISTTFLIGYADVVAFLLIYFGACLFTISDTMNGYAKFVNKFKFERIITMFTYIIGQLMIVLGILYL